MKKVEHTKAALYIDGKKREMPEYCQVETVVQCNQHTFQLALEQLSKFLSQLGYKHTELIPWISQITWSSSDEDRDAHILNLPKTIVLNRLEPLPCAGLEVLIQRDVNPISSNDGWLKPGILFDAETVRDISTGRYKPEVGKTLWYLFQQLAGVFREGGIYFTDEWQEGRVVWTVAGLRRELNLWAFDLALIPNTLAIRFGTTPEVMQRIDLGDWIGFARSDRWPRLPWNGG
ncbi:MAG: hypothetical protein WCD86_20190 [Ktedonobacteraceae bacterium]